MKFPGKRVPSHILGDTVVGVHVRLEPGEPLGVVHAADLALVALAAVVVGVVPAQDGLVANLLITDRAIVYSVKRKIHETYIDEKTDPTKFTTFTTFCQN